MEEGIAKMKITYKNKIIEAKPRNYCVRITKR